MFGFGKRKYWVNKDGKVECPGDACKHTCTEECPIYLNTQAMVAFMQNKPDVASKKLVQVINIEPNLREAYKNLGAANGMLGRYAESVKAYKIYLEFFPDDLQALYGVAVSYKNEKKYLNALEYCDKYRKAGGDPSEIKKIEDACNNYNPKATSGYTDILEQILEDQKATGAITYSKTVPKLPEVSDQVDKVCQKIFKEGKVLKPAVFVQFCPMWCAYAGMGAVKLWSDDFKTFKSKPVIDLLIAPRGFGEMDEYVTSLIGLKFGGNKDDKLRNSLRSIVVKYLNQYSKQNDVDSESETLSAVAKAMYYYGMIYEMNRLGIECLIDGGYVMQSKPLNEEVKQDIQKYIDKNYGKPYVTKREKEKKEKKKLEEKRKKEEALERARREEERKKNPPQEDKSEQEKEHDSGIRYSISSNIDREKLSEDADLFFDMLNYGPPDNISKKTYDWGYGIPADYKLPDRFLDYLIMYINRSGMTNVEVYKRANLSKAAFSAIMSDYNRIPKKTTIIALAVALKLNLKDTETLLMKAGYTFSNSIIGDLVVVYFINKKKFNVDEINRALYDLKQPLLGSKSY